MQNPLVAKWTGPYGGVPPFDKVKVEHFKPALEAAMAEHLAEIDAHRRRPRAARRSRTPSPRWRTPAARSTASSTIYGIWSSTMSDARVPGGRARDGARSSPRSRDEITQNEKLFKRIEAVYKSPREGQAHARAAAARRGCTTRTSSRARRQARRGGEEARSPRSTSASPTLYTKFSQNVLADEESYVADPRQRGRPRGPARLACAPAPRPPPRREGTQGQVGDHQHALVDGAVPHLLDAPRPAREGVAHVRQPRRQRRRARQQRDHHRDPAAARRARQAARLPDATRTGASRTRWRRRPSARMELMEAVWTPAVARVREEVADMQAIADKEGAKHQDRAVGLPLLRGEGPQGEVRPRPERGEAVPAAREAARGDVLGRRRAVRLHVHAGRRTCPVYHPDVRVWEVTDKASGKHVGLWYFDPVRARRASARARG